MYVANRYLKCLNSCIFGTTQLKIAIGFPAIHTQQEMMYQNEIQKNEVE